MPQTTGPGKFPLQNCKYCNSPIAMNALNRHEIRCEKATPGERDARSRSRANAREVAERFAASHGGVSERRIKYRESMNIPVPQGGHRRVPCPYCGEQIGNGNLSRHKLVCASATPEQRRRMAKNRAYQIAHQHRAPKNFREPHDYPALQQAVQHAQSVMKNGNGKLENILLNPQGNRISLTVSFDMETVRDLVMFFLQRASIDGWRWAE